MFDRELIAGFRILSYRTVPFEGTINRKRMTAYLNNYAEGEWEPGKTVRTDTHQWFFFESAEHLLILIHEEGQLTSVLLERERSERKE